MSAYSPGPWIVSDDQIVSRGPAPGAWNGDDGGGPYCVARRHWACSGDEPRTKQWETDAKLIAAAPMLLLMLRETTAVLADLRPMLDALKDDTGRAIDKTLNAARELLRDLGCTTEKRDVQPPAYTVELDQIQVSNDGEHWTDWPGSGPLRTSLSDYRYQRTIAKGRR